MFLIIKNPMSFTKLFVCYPKMTLFLSGIAIIQLQSTLFVSAIAPGIVKM